jgi:hypothetical protein
MEKAERSCGNPQCHTSLCQSVASREQEAETESEWISSCILLWIDSNVIATSLPKARMEQHHFQIGRQ